MARKERAAQVGAGVAGAGVAGAGVAGAAVAGGGLDVNEVRLCGRLSVDPEERQLPSGDAVVVFRLVVRRPSETRSGRRPMESEGPEPRRPAASRPRVDTLECAVWESALRRRVVDWRAGDVVEVEGAMRPRFYRGAGGTASRVEVEVARGRIRRRAAAG